MAHHTRIRANLAAWTPGSAVLQTEYDLFDAAQFAAVDGDAGGIWSPSSQIILGGAGLTAGAKFSAPGIGLYNAVNPTYAADPTGIADSTTALQLAHDAAFSVFGGEVVLMPGVYKFNSGLTWKNSVSLRAAVPGTVSLSLNHATADFLTLSTGTNYDTPIVFSGLNFEGNIANTGRIFYDSGVTARALVIKDCSVNKSGTNLQGTFFSSTVNASSRYLLDNNNVKIVGSAAYGARCDAGLMVIRHGKFTMPAAFGNWLVYGTGGKHVYQGVLFDTSAHTAGSGNSVGIGGQQATMNGCLFDDGGGNGTTQVTWTTGTELNASGNRGHNCLIYGLPGGVLAIGSMVDLHPLEKVTTAGAAITASTGYAAANLKMTNTSAPTITLPTILYPGQTFDLTIYNGTAATNWGFSLANYGLKETQTTVNFGTGVCARFVAGDPTLSGTYTWIQQSKWTYIAP